MHEFIESMEVVTDIVITLGSAWIGFLFWRTYQRQGNVRSALLSILFFGLTAYFGFQVVAVDGFGLKGFGWMESHEALEFMLMAMILALSIVLTPSGTSWRGTKLKPEQKGESEKHKAA